MKHLVPPLLLGCLLVACGNQGDALDSAGLDPSANAACALDGMVLADYPGPKGQIRFADGQVDFFCDTVELLSLLIEPEQVKPVRGAFVQDMAHADWQKPVGHWIDARQAFYVIGSSQTGSMGPTFASFSSRTDAERFAARHSGQVYSFAEVKPDMVKLDGGVLKDQGM
ncbi:nitrous oxide reductase accessory protein NosL [Laribacter hongkongensis]|uniref:Nitrous oxide reductase accessory protein NosL n=1 Tax=Laribacter hongkongensis TaxID=168471 RepID=A0A248LIM1_9NEIS|nr:nitrous oxide reductase accessory protein NosL [Laribacter hongkongensis]ASJ24349.1 nitrous oxide reductase accessory protein NosL [Laribacter hongkongensis]MCG9042045.1 nitrous oxide reductase accessory protein NosL [Laribacter hongkongensis]MCG9054177.1 nitrous oxide reductase accessory protein NosL [Laribacter hongkongensis]MCG9069225.1 nitrous oxide reductase accessory protein NosL [Laribacter hongkongensis]MCG9083888.1 nitrous oxide reductase accessory protein NosL [Laribacter hongkong